MNFIYSGLCFWNGSRGMRNALSSDGENQNYYMVQILKPKTIFNATSVCKTQILITAIVSMNFKLSVLVSSELLIDTSMKLLRLFWVGVWPLWHTLVMSHPMLLVFHKSSLNSKIVITVAIKKFCFRSLLKTLFLLKLYSVIALA